MNDEDRHSVACRWQRPGIENVVNGEMAQFPKGVERDCRPAGVERFFPLEVSVRLGNRGESYKRREEVNLNRYEWNRCWFERNVRRCPRGGNETFTVAIQHSLVCQADPPISVRRRSE